ncbi:hypothetical protein GC105_01770 [Alkalibaculum sp. M08DMB]|uniref:Accessory regulator AgrB n=1 Tax=Alkalibaculum sporogenes TaxID=2655001 RepID=A0A6A7K564_9FIRM|nr:accessory gene regulator B family protein [Alkalibaculum sporogenes]MPW24520.1 hypothetical protein [Alkalibaculum sporogenes]
MINQLVNRIEGHFGKYYEFGPYEEEKLRYSLEVIIGEVSKCVILFFISSFFYKQWELLYSMIALCTIRPFSGGLHFKTYWACLIFTGLFFGAIICFHNTVPINYNFYTLSFVVALLAVLLLAPLTCEKRPSYTKEKRTKFKVTAIVILTFYFILFQITNGLYFFTIGIWVMLFQSIQLILAKGVQIHGKTKKLI